MNCELSLMNKKCLDAFCLFFKAFSIFQYYRQARQRALHIVFPELLEEEQDGIGMVKYPRPYSEPPSPSSSRHTTPAASVHGSDDESDSVDSEGELEELKANHK